MGIQIIPSLYKKKKKYQIKSVSIELEYGLSLNCLHYEVYGHPQQTCVA